MIQREKFKLIPGVPFICTLETTEAKPFSSRFHDGQEWLYNVEHRGAAGMLYLPVDGHTALQRLQLQAGDEVQLLKQQTQGQSATFTARRVSDATLAVPALPARDPNRAAPRPTADQFDQHMRDLNGARQEIAAAAPTGQGVRMLAPQTQQQPQTNGATAYAPQTQAANEAPQPGSIMLGQCLLAAIDAAIGAERYALAKGKTLAFNEEDIRAMGLSIYIGKQREGR